MAATTTPLLTALLKKSTLNDHDELLKASNAALKKSKTDTEAQRVKVVALIKLDRYEEAVKFAEECGPNLKEKAALEYSYALYKIGRLEEAVQLSSTLNDRGGRHVEAQTRYRMEDTARTAELYRELRQQLDSNEDFDLRVNQGAIDAQAQWTGLIDSGSIRRPGREDLEAFETAFNAACGSIARGEFAQAEVLLKRAKELCKHSEDLSEETKAEELLPISVQQLYVLHNLGKTAEAENIAKDISIESISDLSTKAVAASNLLLTSSNVTNPFVAYKNFSSTPRLSQSDKLFSYQLIPYHSNKQNIELKAFKFDGVAASTQKTIASQSSPTVVPDVLLSSVFNAAAHARNEVSKAAIKKVLPELSKHPNDVGLIITLVQMYILTGNPTSAIDLIESLFRRLDESTAESEKDVRFNPGLVSILINLYRSQGRRPQIKQELAKAASYWRHKSKSPGSLLKAAGSALLDTSSTEDAKEAAEIFDKLREQQPKDMASIAGYVASHVIDEKSDAIIDSEAEKLSSISDLTRNIDVDALERAGIPQSSNALAIAQLTRTRKRAAPDGSSTKPKRVRKSRLPKDHDPNKVADPERWLPLKDRSTYKAPRSKKKGKKAGDDRTQGGAVNEDLNIDAKPSTQVIASSGGAANKKKKGKGKK